MLAAASAVPIVTGEWTPWLSFLNTTTS